MACGPRRQTGGHFIIILHLEISLSWHDGVYIFSVVVDISSLSSQVTGGIVDNIIEKLRSCSLVTLFMPETNKSKGHS